jgi:alpha-tubulin suppressor-like RCC1 family protein
MRQVHSFVFLGLVALGCGSATDDSLVGHTVASITAIPAAVRCMQVQITDAMNISRTVSTAVMGGIEFEFDLGVIDPGSVTFRGNAFSQACAAITAGDRAAWVSDPVTVNVRRGYTTHVPLLMRPNAPTTATVDFVTPVTAIASNPTSNAMYAILQDGTLRAWGANSAGQLGDTSVTNRRRPVEVNRLAFVTRLAIGGSHACALLRDGTAYCWGNNASGQLGLGTIGGSETSPLPVAGARIFGSLSASSNSTCGVVTNAGALPQVYCWGANSVGELGNGTTGGTQSTPTASSFAAAADVAAGASQFCGLGGSARLACWGLNGSGQLGNGTTTSSASPSSSLFPQVRSFAMGGAHSCVIDALRRIWCAGNNGTGQLGTGNTTSSATPVQVMGIDDATQVALGTASTYALRSDGTVWAWGFNANNELGNVNLPTSMSTVSVPTRVPELNDVVQIAAGANHACALKRDGTVWCWGSNGSGQIGDGSILVALSPTQVRF